MDRKTFIQKTVGAMLITLPMASLISCSSSDNGSANPDPDPNPDPQGNCTANGTKNAIGGNHGHTLAVSKEDVTAGAQKVYSIQGSSEHNHSVTISVDNFNTLKSNKSIQVSSTEDDGHTHSVTVSCA